MSDRRREPGGKGTSSVSWVVMAVTAAMAVGVAASLVTYATANRAQAASSAAPPAPPTAPAPSAASAPHHPIRDRRIADAVRERLAARKAEKAGEAPPASGLATAVPAPSAVTPLPRRMPEHSNRDGTNENEAPLGRYIKAVVHEQFVPLAGECYGALLKRQPGAKFGVSLDFTVEGDADTGGVVTDASLGDHPPGDDEFRTCFLESMKSVVFDAPPGEGITVRYPFELAP